VEWEPTVIQIKGFVNSSFSSMILIDFGSTHNMISADFAKRCLVLLPNNHSSSIDHWLVNVLVSIQRVDTIVDFEVWNRARYNVILGMVWLQEVDAWFACKEGAVHGKLQNGKAFCIKGKRSLPNIPLLSHLQLKRSIKKMNEVFLIYLNGVQMNEVKGNNIDRMDVKVFLEDFKDVFLDDLKDLPPKREIDHAIDLVANTALAKAPYHHSLAQKSELESQFNDLLSKGYIRPSKSSWGAPVLFVKRKMDL
jgi:hypothetical protein